MAKSKSRRAVLIAGPTASGKTAFAIEMAQARGGIVINTDSMQVYGVLDRLTARPNAQELAAAPHVLFGHVDPGVRYSTGAWLADAEKALQAAHEQQLEPIFVGGTGLYFDALTKGLSPVPPIPDKEIQAVEALVQGMDADERLAFLREHDPELAERLAVADPQRVVRAVSVKRATGRALSAFQRDTVGGLLSRYALEKIVLNPERAALRHRIAERFAAMMAAGAVGEVEALLARKLDPSLPAMKAIGVKEITAYLSGAMDRDAAVDKAVTATRQYAKRQSTWFRNRMGDWRVLDPLSRSFGS